MDTYGIEAMMQDGKALQFGTSHDLGQNFAKAFEIMFTDKDGEKRYPYQNSWGVSTRMMGAIIMTHSDDNGLVLPPTISPVKVVIIPIFNENEKEKVLSYCEEIKKSLDDIEGVEIDYREYVSAGFKFNEWEKKGVPLRIEVGPRDIQNSQAVLVRRDTGDKESIGVEKIGDIVEAKLEDIQKTLLNRSKELLVAKTHRVGSYEELRDVLKDEKGFVLAHWCGNSECEEKIKSETKATTRCLTKEGMNSSGKCIICGKESKEEWVFSISY